MQLVKCLGPLQTVKNTIQEINNSRCWSDIPGHPEHEAVRLVLDGDGSRRVATFLVVADEAEVPQKSAAGGFQSRQVVVCDDMRAFGFSED